MNVPRVAPSDAPARGLTARTYFDWEAFHGLQPEWDDLLARSAANSIFLRFDWVRSWLDTYGSKTAPVLVVVRNAAGQLVAVAPFYLAEYRLLDGVRCRALHLAADWPTGAECQDLIVDPSVEARAIESIAGELLACRAIWDFLWMPYVLGWSGGLARLERLASAAHLWTRERDVDFAVVELPRDMQAYEQQLASDMRQQLRRKKKKLLAREGVEFLECRHEGDLPRFLDALFDLNARRWATTGQVGTFLRKPAEAAFYRVFSRIALRAGWLRIFAVAERGEFKAVQFGYKYNSSLLQMQEGFAPEYCSGVGNVLRHHAFAGCIADGLRQYDFLAGMSEHKRRWLGSVRKGRNFLAGHAGLLSSVLRVGKVWPNGRYLMRTDTSGGVPSGSLVGALS